MISLQRICQFAMVGIVSIALISGIALTAIAEDQIPAEYEQPPSSDSTKTGIIIIRPTADYDRDIPKVNPVIFRTHWDKLDDAIPDGILTEVWTNDSSWRYDLFSHDFDQLGYPELDIVSVKIFARLQTSLTNADNAKPVIWDCYDHTLTFGDTWTVSPFYKLYEQDITALKTSWTWNDIRNRKFGIALKKDGLFNTTGCTQLYMEVEYNLSLHEPEGIAFDNNGNMYVSSINGDNPGSIFRIAAEGTFEEFVYPELHEPNGLALDTEGNLFVADFGPTGGVLSDGDGSVYKIDTDDMTISQFATGMSNPDGLAFDKAGNLYVSDFIFSGAIYRVTPDGTTTLFCDSLSLPNGLAFSPDGSALFAALTFPSKIVSIPINPDGTSGKVGTIHNGLMFPDGIAFDVAGNIYVARAWIPIVSVITTDGKTHDLVGLGELSFPTSIAFGLDGFDSKSLYIVNRGMFGKGNLISVAYVGIDGLPLNGP